MGIKDNEEPPSEVNLGIGARVFSADGSMVRRFKGIRELWADDWGISPIRGIISRRCYSILTDISKE